LDGKPFPNTEVTVGSQLQKSILYMLHTESFISFCETSFSYFKQMNGSLLKSGLNKNMLLIIKMKKGMCLFQNSSHHHPGKTAQV
jgi:hypothetical protein